MPVKPAEAARRLLSKADVTEWPVPVEYLAQLCRARIEYEPFAGDISGMLFRSEDRRIIGINSAHVRGRQRFTIAHELGHLLLHEGRQIIVDKAIRVPSTGGAAINLRDRTSSLATDTEEIQANSFAAELLLPADLVKSAVNAALHEQKSISDDELIKILADQFRVSGQAVELRLTKLRILLTHVLMS